MFESRVLGVDPGTAALGLAVVVTRGPAITVEWAQTVRTTRGVAPAERLRRVHASVREAIRTHHPESMAIERLLWGRAAGSAMEVSRAAGAVIFPLPVLSVTGHQQRIAKDFDSGISSRMVSYACPDWRAFIRKVS